MKLFVLHKRTPAFQANNLITVAGMSGQNEQGNIIAEITLNQGGVSSTGIVRNIVQQTNLNQFKWIDGINVISLKVPCRSSTGENG